MFDLIYNKKNLKVLVASFSIPCCPILLHTKYGSSLESNMLHVFCTCEKATTEFGQVSCSFTCLIINLNFKNFLQPVLLMCIAIDQIFFEVSDLKKFKWDLGV